MSIEGNASGADKRVIIPKNYFSNNHTTVKASNDIDLNGESEISYQRLNTIWLDIILTQCGQVRPYGDRDLGQHWFK